MEGEQAVKFRIGDRVKTTVESQSAWSGAWGAPKGAAGTITSVYRTSYGALLDDDPAQMSAVYGKDELEAES